MFGIGGIPNIEIKYLDSKEDIWTSCFMNENIQSGSADSIKAYGGLSYNAVTDIEEIKVYSWVFKKFCCFNRLFEKYVTSKLEQIRDKCKGKKCLGISLRGTDFRRLQPKGHPKQPELGEVIDKVCDIVKTYQFDYIYITTEEKKTIDLFGEFFPIDKILFIEREYYDEAYNENATIQYVTQVTFSRENDLRLREWEYLVSIIMLSECDALCGSNCGATRLGLIMNDNKYEFTYIFDKGLY